MNILVAIVIVILGFFAILFGSAAAVMIGKDSNEKKLRKQNELLDEGKYKVIRVGNFFTNSDYYYSDLELSPEKYIDYGDLIFAWSASFGAFIWQGDKVIYHYHIWKILFDDTRSCARPNV